MFQALSAHLQEDTIVYMQHTVLSISPGGLLVHSIYVSVLILFMLMP